MKTPKAFLGAWRISETERWGADARDEGDPAHITFDARGGGSFQMVCLQGEIDPRFEGDGVEFSWMGHDDMDEANGRGWA